MSQHKVVYLVPSNQLEEFQKAVKDLLASEYNIKHAGAWPYDPNKTQFVTRKVATDPPWSNKTNGTHAPPRIQVIDQVLDILTKERRPFSSQEMMRRVGVSGSAVSASFVKLAAVGKARKVQRGVYEIV